jgi:hypothetical protein
MKLSFATFLVLVSATNARTANGVEGNTRHRTHAVSKKGARSFLRGEARAATGIINGHVAQPGEYPYAVSLQHPAASEASGAKLSLTEASWCDRCRGNNDKWDNDQHADCEGEEDVSGLVD